MLSSTKRPSSTSNPQREANDPSKVHALGPFQVVCLAAVIACGDHAYEAPIRKQVQKLLTPPRSVALCQVVQALNRLQQIGLLCSHFPLATSLRARRLKRCFHITADGHESLLIAAQNLENDLARRNIA